MEQAKPADQGIGSFAIAAFAWILNYVSPSDVLILGFLVFGLAIAALVMGIVALVRRNGTVWAAIVGIVLSGLLCLMFLLFFVVGVVAGMAG